MNERIRYLRQTLGLSMEKFGKEIGLSKSGISEIESGRRNVTEQHIKLISAVEGWNVSETWLRTGDGEMFIKTPNTLIGQMQQRYNMDNIEIRILESYLALPEEKRNMFRDFIYSVIKNKEEIHEEKIKTRIIHYYQRLASAGTGEVIFEDMPDDRIEIPDIPEYKRVAYAIGVNGHSMEPLYQDGDMLLIEPTCSVNIGEIGIFNVDGKAYVKKLGVGELISINEGYDNIPITKESLCMGRVVDKYIPKP